MGQGMMEKVWHVSGQDPSILILGRYLASPWDSFRSQNSATLETWGR